MGPRGRVSAIVLTGFAYAAIGLGFSALARQSGPRWRFAAWAISAAVFGAHIAYEHIRLRTAARRTALSAALGVALGGLGLAAAATLRQMGSAGFRPGLVIALVAWPLLLGIPAFLVALAATAGLSLVRRNAGT